MQIVKVATFPFIIVALVNGEASNKIDKTLFQIVTSKTDTNLNKHGVVMKTGERHEGFCNISPTTDCNEKVPTVEQIDNRENIRPIGVLELFKFSDKIDVVLLIGGLFIATLGGLTQPMNILIFGQLSDDFITAVRNDNGSSMSTIYEELVDKATDRVVYLCILGVITFCVSTVADTLWCYIAERQVRRIRKLLFDSILKQDMSWFDLRKGGELSSRYSEDILKIKDGMGDKVGMFFRLLMTYIICVVMAIILNWKLALAALSFSPVLLVAEGYFTKMLRTISETESKAYARAGAIAEEAISAIRTVTAYSGQKKEHDRYSENLQVVEKVLLKKGFVLGLCLSVFYMTVYLLMALTFWYGTTLFQEGGYRPRDIVVVFYGIMMSSFLFGDALPFLESFATARGAAAYVYSIIALKPKINAYYEMGDELTTVEGTLTMEGVAFHYPSRPDVTVLHETSLDIHCGQRVALVGPSGSGKSSIVKLLLRFYDANKGKISLDGRDIKTLNLKWYRDLIGVVSQEPVLFATTIAENIRYGREDVTQKQIEDAAVLASAHAFIENLPDKYNTIVGGRGQQLSGGQKQRIAIARALVKNPKFLFLDEATSALDNENEILVQNALDVAQKGRTTLIVAHRLSTIKQADKIIVLNNGEVIEVGTYNDLMQKQSHFYHLVTQQAAEEDKLSSRVESRNDGVVEEYEKTINSSNGISVNFDQKMAETFKTEEFVDQDDGKKSTGILIRLIKLNSSEWLYIVFGCVACVFTGSILPILGFLFGEFLRVLSIRDEDEQMKQTKMVAYIDIGIAAVLFSGHLVKMLSFVVAGSRLTLRLRKMVFESILRQDIAFFDEDVNQVGHLTSRLSSDAAIVHGATGSKIGTLLETITTLTAMLVIAFSYSWKLSLVILSFLPLIVFAGMIGGRAAKGSVRLDKKLGTEAGNIYTQVIDSIATVTSLNAQQQFKAKYDSIVDELYTKGRRYSVLHGVTFALSACTVYFVYAGSLMYGATLFKKGEIQFHDVFRVLIVIIFGGFSIGKESMCTPDFAKAKLAAQRLFHLIDKVPCIDPFSKSGTIPAECTGDLDLNSLQFHYPSRPGAFVLKDINLCVKKGQTVALVGESGCGKTTIAQLLTRSYDPDSGTISLNHMDIGSLNVSWLRSQIGIVPQEPVLFDCSIERNIAYGDNSRDVNMTEIIQASRAANIHDFIKSLPQGYDTNVGVRGTQLSGGQKQRVAIARALIRNPKILILDEATSALDTESEKIVQDAIDRATEGRTCIVIAHRLSTLVNADQIAVINNGVIEETGTHAELIAKQGKYHTLYKIKDKDEKIS